MLTNRIYTITYTSYDGCDNYLYSETKVTSELSVAEVTFDNWCRNARANAMGEENEYKISANQSELTYGDKEFCVSRQVGSEGEYQAKIRLVVTDL